MEHLRTTLRTYVTRRAAGKTISPRASISSMSTQPLLLFALFLTTASGASAALPETPDATSRACNLVTPEEAATLLGPKAERVEGDQHGTCFYMVKGQSLQLVIRIEEMNATPTMFLNVVRKP